MSKTTLNMKQVQEHFAAVREDKALPLEVGDVKGYLKEDLPKFCQELVDIRLGNIMSEDGKKFRARHVDFGFAVVNRYGLAKAEKLPNGEKQADLKTMLGYLGFDTAVMSFSDIADATGLGTMNTVSFEALMKESFAAPASVSDINSAFRFILPEVVLQAVRTGYVHSAYYNNWIAGSQPSPQQKATLPRILRGDTMPYKIKEGGLIPSGSLAFDKKEVNTYKVGIGFKITDELLMQSSLDMLFLFLQEVGNDMAIGTDVEALDVLVNGEQADLSESSPVIGVTDTAVGLQMEDVDRVMTRMNRLNFRVNRIIASEDIKNADLNADYASRERMKLEDYTGLPVDVHKLPTASQVMFIDTTRAMVQMNFGGMKVERIRRPETQIEETYVTMFIGFFKVRRDAAVIVDTTVAYSGTIGATGGFPSYMDIDSRISATFRVA